MCLFCSSRTSIIGRDWSLLVFKKMSDNAGSQGSPSIGNPPGSGRGQTPPAEGSSKQRKRSPEAPATGNPAASGRGRRRLLSPAAPAEGSSSRSGRGRGRGRPPSSPGQRSQAGSEHLNADQQPSLVASSVGSSRRGRGRGRPPGARGSSRGRSQVDSGGQQPSLAGSGEGTVGHPASSSSPGVRELDIKHHPVLQGFINNNNNNKKFLMLRVEEQTLFLFDIYEAKTSIINMSLSIFVVFY